MYPRAQPFHQNMPPNGWVVIRSQMHGKVLDIAEGSSQPGTRVIMWTQKSPTENNQIWRFEACSGGWYNIISAVNNNLVLDVEGGRNGAPLVVWNRKSPPEPNQMFRLNGNQLESAVGTGLVVDIEGANTTDGANVILYSQSYDRNSRNQLFDLQMVAGPGAQPVMTTFHTASYGQPTFGTPQMNPYGQPAYNPSAVPTLSHQPMNVTHSPYQQGNTSHLSYQQFNTAPTMSMPAAGGMGSWVVIRSRMHGKVLDAEGGRAKAGTPVILWDPDFATNQKWRFEACGNGWCHIVSALNSNLVLDVEGGQEGGPIILWDRKYPAEPNQMFRMKGKCIESALRGGMVLDIEGGSRSDGARLIVFSEKYAGDRTNQEFDLQSV